MKKLITYITIILLSFQLYGQDSINTINEDDKVSIVKILIYPNPVTNSWVNIVMDSEEMNTTFSLYNILGEEVLTSALTNGDNRLNVSGLNAGLYFYVVERNGKIADTKKLVIKN